MGAYYREHPCQRLRPEAARTTSTGHPLLNTSAGPLYVLGVVAGNLDYTDVLPHTVELSLDEATWIRILDLGTLIVTKQLTGRDKDKLVLPILQRTLEEIERASEHFKGPETDEESGSGYPGHVGERQLYLASAEEVRGFTLREELGRLMLKDYVDRLVYFSVEREEIIEGSLVCSGRIEPTVLGWS